MTGEESTGAIRQYAARIKNRLFPFGTESSEDELEEFLEQLDGDSLDTGVETLRMDVYGEIAEDFREWVEEEYAPGLEGFFEFQKDMPAEGHIKATGRDWTYVTRGGIELQYRENNDE